MKLFKNEVGRPSNETLKKRKMVIIAIIAAAVLLVGGVTFALVKTFKPVEGTEKNAEANKFVVVKNSNTCYTVYAPTKAKYWGVHVYYKQTGSSTFGNRKISSISKYHDNDGVTSQKICFTKQTYSNETFRILVRWNQGSNHKVYSTPNTWRPSGYYSNNAIGWAYRDYAINWGGSSSSTGSNSNNNSSNSNTKASLTVTEPTQTKYTNSSRVQISFKHNQNKTMYYTFVNYNNKVAGYKQPCSTISANQTKYFTLDVNANSTSRYSVIKLFSDSKCSKQVDSKKTKTYYYSKPDYAKLIVTEPKNNEYTTPTKLQFSFYADTTYNTLFYKFTTYYETFSDNEVHESYTQPCSVIKKGDTKYFTMDLNSTAVSRFAKIQLYTDNRCERQVDSESTVLYMYTSKYGARAATITKACQKNGYVYVTAYDHQGIEWVDWSTSSGGGCGDYDYRSNEATKVDLRVINNFKIKRKYTDSSSKKYVCVSNFRGVISIKNVSKSC